MPGYMPKRIDCKAKTADAEIFRFEVAGLVVDPAIHPSAFKPTRLQTARECWSAMKYLIGTVYEVNQDRTHKHYGCLRLKNGPYIHGDYDLYDIIDVERAGENSAREEIHLGQPDMRGPMLGEVQAFVNGRLGVAMIQHGAEAQFKDHSEQSIDAFGPHGEDVTILNEYSVRAWYKDRFEGRQPLVKT